MEMYTILAVICVICSVTVFICMLRLRATVRVDKADGGLVQKVVTSFITYGVLPALGPLSLGFIIWTVIQVWREPLVPERIKLRCTFVWPEPLVPELES